MYVCLYKTPFFIGKSSQNVIPTERRLICLCFCLVTVSLIHFDYVTYLHTVLIIFFVKNTLKGFMKCVALKIHFQRS